jgi:hypothetical protein
MSAAGNPDPRAGEEIQEYAGSLLEQAVEPTHPLFLLPVAPVLRAGNPDGEPPGTQRLPVLVKSAGQEIRYLLLKQRVFPPLLRFQEAVLVLLFLAVNMRT